VFSKDDIMKCFPGRSRTGWATFVLFCLAALLFSGLVIPSWQALHAQETGEKKDTTATDSGPKEEPKLVVHIIKSAGWVFGPILFAVSLCLVALIILLAMDLRMGVAIPPYFVEEFTDTVNKRKFKEAFEISRSDSSYLGRVLTAGMGRLQYGIDDAREAAFNTVESIKASKEQLITYLATIGTLGPMLGLVGTVFGMIKSFLVLAIPGARPEASKLAEGISHALVVTLIGIALAVPAIFFHAFFRNRLIRIAMDTSNIADDLLTQMYHNSRRPASTAAAPEARTPTAQAAPAPATAGIKPA
jgi:biopolymer transport protein ExbB